MGWAVECLRGPLVESRSRGPVARHTWAAAALTGTGAEASDEMRGYLGQARLQLHVVARGGGAHLLWPTRQE